METFSENGYTYQRWKVGASTFTACMELGARLMRWELALPTGKREVICWPENADMTDIANVRGGNPVLFPFVGRNFIAGEKFFWRDLEGVKRPMPGHGLARQARFEISKSGDNFVEARFVPPPEAAQCYPFKYTFFVRYFFEELSLRCEFELVNEDAEDLPWCPGHHFYFGLPWHAGVGRDGYEISVPAKKTWNQAADGKLVPFAGGKTQTTFDDPGLIDCIFTKLTRNAVTFGPKSGEENVTIRIGDEPVPDAWTTLVTWTEKPDSPFYCVEPWAGPPNSPEHKNGLRKVAVGTTEKFVVSVSLT